MKTLKLRGETVWLGSHPPTALPFQEPDEEVLRRVILHLVYMLLYYLDYFLPSSLLLQVCKRDRNCMFYIF